MGVLRLIFGIIFLPVTFSLMWEFGEVTIGLFGSETFSVIPFWVGIVSYVLFQIILFKPLRTYVFGHELTHALAGILNGARLKKFKVSKSGGSVALTKTSFFIALSPYFIPIYTLAVMLLYPILSYFMDIGAYRGIWVFLIGFTLAFHISLTYYAIMQGQSDLEKFGVFFSIVSILGLNCIVLIAVLKIIFPGMIGLRAYFIDSGKTVFFVGTNIVEEAIKLWTYFRQTK